MTVRLLALLVGAVAGLVVDVAAQPAIGRRYQGVDGLAHNTVDAIVEDSRGFIWLATAEGVSRFDGYQLRAYGLRDGLRSVAATSIVEDRDGRLWIGTFGGGVSRLREGQDAENSPAFESFLVDPAVSQANEVSTLFVDAAGNLWCINNAGLYRARAPFSQPRFERVVASMWPGWAAAYRDSQDRSWFSLGKTIARVTGDRVDQFAAADGLDDQHVIGFAERGAGRLIVLTTTGLYEAAIDNDAPPRWRTMLATLPRRLGRALAIDGGGRILVGTSAGLFRFESSGETTQLTGSVVHSLAHDAAGNLWVGTGGEGLLRIAPEGFTVLHRNDRGDDGAFARLLMLGDGTVAALATSGELFRVDRPGLTPLPTALGSRLEQARERTIVDAAGRWWIPTPGGLYLASARTEPARRLLTDRVFAVLDTGDGRVLGTTTEFLYEWRLSDPWSTPRRYKISVDGLFLSRMTLASSGTVWMSAYAGLTRLRKGHPIERLPIDHGLAADSARALLVDRRGWLWVGLRTHGLAVTQNPDADRPLFRRWTTEEGLSSDAVFGLIEDPEGRILAVTGRGIDRLDASSGTIERIPASFMPPDQPNQIVKDGTGRIWLAGLFGVARLDNIGTRPARRAPVPLLTSVSAGGRHVPLGERGARELDLGALPGGVRSVELDFVGLDFIGEQSARYQYRLSGIMPEWSEPAERRSVAFAGLPAGTYTFEVRAITTDEREPLPPARVHFSIPLPFWWRWWFLSLVAVAVTAAAAGLHVLRVRRLLAVERLRRQVAADLHDDIGSGLTEIALMSDLARRRRDPAGDAPLSEISGVARALRESMSDIVWAIDPRHDRATDLLQRMKDLAYRVLESDGTDVTFHVANDAAGKLVTLDAGRRRHVLRFFKEAVTNISRHAGARRVVVTVSLSAGELHVTIEDDGCGFTTQKITAGHGLGNLAARASELGGRSSVDSQPGQGTRVDLWVPLTPRMFMRLGAASRL